MSTITVSSGGYVVATSGTVDNLNVYPGGLAISGYAVQGNIYGGTLSSNTVTALVGVWSAVLLEGTTVYQSGATTVTGPIALNNNAILYVTNGAIASEVEDAGGALGYIYVNSGGSLENSNINFDIVTVYSGGKTNGNTFKGSAGSYVANYGVSVNDTYNTEDNSISQAYFYSGASVSGATVTNGTTLVAYDGVVIDGVKVDAGGTVNALADTASVSGITVSSGGVASLASSVSSSAYTVSAGGLISAGASTVYGGINTSTNVTALTGVWSAVLVDGKTIYQSGADANIKRVNGPVALDDDAQLYITNGATASGVEDAGGALGYIYVSSGGTLADSKITYDLVTVYAGGKTTGNTFEGNAGSYVANYGTSINDTYNTKSNSTSLAYFYSGASISSAIVADGTTLSAYDSVTVDGIIVSSGGVASLASSISNSAYTVSAGGLISAGASTVYGGVGTSTNVAALTGIWSAVLVDGTTVYQSATGTSVTTVSGPIALDDNAILYVTNGATASGIEDAGGALGYIYVNSGGTLADSKITYDLVTVYAGGKTTGNTFAGYAGSYVANFGSSINDTYSTEGPSASYAYFYSGASISGATVNKGASLNAYVGSTLDKITVSSGGTVTTGVTCFLSGSMIRTPVGDVAIEKIKIGDEVSVFDWKNNAQITSQVVWIGIQELKVNSNVCEQEAGFPVRVLRNAIADGVPYKDMLITPEHCLFFQDRFVPVRMLVNGRSIFYDRSFTHYTYYHIETEQHSVIWADGMLTESYLDTGNRGGFRQNGTVVLFDTKTNNEVRSWKTDGAAPLDVLRDFVEPLYYSLSKRNGSDMTPPPLPNLTNEADLHLVTQTGQKIFPARCKGQENIFMLPKGIQKIRIVSRSSRPCDTIGPFVDDRRFLGVLVGKITLFDGQSLMEVKTHIKKEKMSGWHDIESSCRWTNGNADLEIDACGTKEICLLSLQVLSKGPYIMEAYNVDREDKRVFA